MNDLEINIAVAEKLGAVNVRPTKEGTNVFWEVKHNFFVKNYCNQWSDAGPIIEKYKINLNFRCMGPDNVRAHVIDDKKRYTAGVEKNPLRAAMLCFLEMEI